MPAKKFLQKFLQTLKHSDLPKGWQDNPEIVEEAGRLYRELGTESPFFKAYEKAVGKTEGISAALDYMNKRPQYMQGAWF